ncbi:lipoate--protein ligase family protein [Paenibacillus sp. HB172176]|uniref:lipoate--protein ligase family protein n=1 Tax=Paenibacillus sp. HB172176 TaxID=2493690 RepID=UPI003211E564
MDYADGNILILDRMNELASANPLRAFALDELLGRNAGSGGPAVCHIWRHTGAFILGPRDSRLPHAMKAAEQLNERGWATVVRNSGGAAVPLDKGVVNISLILPKAGGEGVHFHNEFELMYRLIRDALQETELPVEKGEIAGAYCPGDFDLSIDGFKFCGIAQRRQRNAIIVQAFIVAAGSGRERAELVRSFYDAASGGDTALDYPIVIADSTASLEELANLGPRAAEAFASRMKHIIRTSQTPSGLAEAASKLRMPGQEELDAMTAILQNRYSIVESSKRS